MKPNWLTALKPGDKVIRMSGSDLREILEVHELENHKGKKCIVVRGKFYLHEYSLRDGFRLESAVGWCGGRGDRIVEATSKRLMEIENRKLQQKHREALRHYDWSIVPMDVLGKVVEILQLGRK